MFNLDQEIRRWRRSMSARLPLHREAVAELESHLRDAVQKQVQAGLEPQQAWTAALAQLGSLDALAAEYGKLSQHAVWRWLPAKVILGGYAVVAAMFACLIGARVLFAKADTLLAVHILTITLGYTAVLAVGAIASWSIVSRALIGWSLAETEVLSRTTRYATAAALALTGVGVVLGGWWFRNHAGQWWAWDPKEIGGVVLVAWNGLVLWLLVRRNDERAGMLLGLTGWAVVTLCWIGPAFVPGAALHSYGGSPWVVTIGLSGLALLVALFAMAFLPPGRLRLRDAD